MVVLSEWLRIDSFIRDVRMALGSVPVCALIWNASLLCPNHADTLYKAGLSKVPPFGLCLFPLKDF